jgi:hypothetical protein
MNEELLKIALMSGMKLKRFEPDEHKQHGWVTITCTEFELETYTNFILQAAQIQINENIQKLNETI